MLEFKSNYSFAGLILALAVIVGGVTYQLTPTGNYKVCDNGVGWTLDQNTGQYTCGDRNFDCVGIRGTKTGKSAYYCDEATRVEIKEVIDTQVVEKVVQESGIKVVGYVNHCDGRPITKYICNGLGPNARCQTQDELELPFR